MATDHRPSPVPDLAVTRMQLPSEGLIADGATGRPLAESQVLELSTRTGDRVYLTTHHGFGYKMPNEDRIAVVDNLGPDGNVVAVFVVDGMGGHRGGDISAQTLAEELVTAYGLDETAFGGHCRELLLARVVEVVDRLPSEEMIERVAADLHAGVLLDGRPREAREILAAAVHAVQTAAIEAPEPDPDSLHRVAEVLGALARVPTPDRADVAVSRARARLARLGVDTSSPDACFVGAVIHTSADGTRTLDVKQVGDCKLFVADSAGRVRFESINESMVPEPDLGSPRLTLEQLLAYSLHRNIVSSSLMSFHTLKKYRRGEIPLELDQGDVVYLYSDGCDDLFAPRELVGLAAGVEPDQFLRTLLGWSEKRMRWVHALLETAQRGRRPEERAHVYPAVHRAMNEARLRNGSYLERYEDGSVGRWVKPPKCDNTAICVVRLGDGRR